MEENVLSLRLLIANRPKSVAQLVVAFPLAPDLQSSVNEPGPARKQRATLLELERLA